MPFAITPTGLNVQSVAEIISELNDDFRSRFGANTDLEPDSVLGNLPAAWAEREANLQQLGNDILQSFDPRFATGVTLDARAALTATFRKPATKSKSTSFLATGVATTIITNGSRFQLIQTGDEWEVVDGPFTIAGGGTIAVTAQAVLTGARTFLTSGPLLWTILTPIVGWTSIEATADLDPEDTGANVETDAALRLRRTDELLVFGNDIDAIRTSVGALVGVTSVAVFDNTSCVAAFDGIPPGAFEVVVDGGVDADIAVAIFDDKPPGAESFGSSVAFPQTTSEGQVIDIFFTRPTDIDIDVEIDYSITGAEHAFPANGEALIAAALLVAFNADADIARNIFPDKYVSDVFLSVQDVNGNDTITSAEVRMRRGVDPFSTIPIVISLRERADFDSANITVTLVP